MRERVAKKITELDITEIVRSRRSTLKPHTLNDRSIKKNSDGIPSDTYQQLMALFITVGKEVDNRNRADYYVPRNGLGHAEGIQIDPEYVLHRAVYGVAHQVSRLAEGKNEIEFFLPVLNPVRELNIAVCYPVLSDERLTRLYTEERRSHSHFLMSQTQEQRADLLLAGYRNLPGSRSSWAIGAPALKQALISVLAS